MILSAILFALLQAIPAISLDGAWEMGYLPSGYQREVHHVPEFKGKMVENAIPGYWEDLFSGPEYYIHSMYHSQDFPISGSAEDMTLPNICGCFFYRKTINIDNPADAALRFEGVRNMVHIWVNGTFVDFHEGYSTPFEIPVPERLLKKGANTIVMAVSNSLTLGYCDFVVGLSSRSVFRGSGGVTGHLELSFPQDDIRDVYVTTAKDLKTVTVHVDGTTPFEWEIPGVGKGRAKGDFTLDATRLEKWTPETPRLYDLTIKTSDEHHIRFGVRRLTAEGERLFLNGRPVYLRGVTEHCYFPLTVHLPRDLEYYRMITAKRKELGFNFVRFHTFVPPVEYLQACDELGMLVHLESPNFVDVPEYEAIVKFAHSHPSVVIYCTGNETRIDRLAEAYLEDVASVVHAASDGLFSPMSALRGLEYALMPGKDVIVDKPFKHNPERFDRVRKYADIFTTYQNSATSYNAINSPYTAEIVDSWGDIYRLPRLAHEICIDGTYVDLSTEKLYPADSPILKAGLFSGLRKLFSERGITEEKAHQYYVNSCEWQRRCRKFCFEKIRSMKRNMGYDFLGDINTHWHTFGYSVGMMDEFYRLKPSETVENVLRYNGPAVILNNLGSDFNFSAGSTKKVDFSISNYDRELSDASLSVSLVDGSGRKVFRQTIPGISAAFGEVSVIASVDVRFPKTSKPQKYTLRAEISGTRINNEWEVYSFPEVSVKAPKGVDVVSDISKDQLLKAMEDGKSVVLFGAGPFKSLPASFQIGLPGRSDGNLATLIKPNHPAMGDFPNEGFCGWQFRRLMQGAPAVQLEAGVPFDPVIDVASSVKMPIRQAFLFEYRVGRGKLLVCSLKFNDSDPAAAYLKSRILTYAGRLDPVLQLTPEQLAAVIDAPLLRGGQNNNLAGNSNDRSSSVRAGKFARP